MSYNTCLCRVYCPEVCETMGTNEKYIIESYQDYYEMKLNPIRLLELEFDWEFNISKNITSFPPNLQILLIDGWTCDELPALPDSLLILVVNRSHIKKLQPNLPPKLRVLDLVDCFCLKELPRLPETIQYIDLGGCKKISRLPLIPFSTKFLLHYVECNYKSCFFDLFNSEDDFDEQKWLMKEEISNLSPRVIENRKKILKVKRRLIEKIRKRTFSILLKDTPMCKDACNVITDFLYAK